MVVVTLLWATAGVLTRQVQHAQGVEVTFWRSVLTAVSMVLILTVWRGPGYWRRVPWADTTVWLSGLLWGIMYTSFMMAISFTTVANVLIMTALNPMFTALASRIFLKHRLPMRTWVAIAVAVLGIAYMYATKLNFGQGREMVGIALALLVPVSASMQFLLMHREKQRAQRLREQALQDGSGHVQQGRDMLPAVLMGAVLSAAFCLPFVPFQASAGDMVWLSLLGMFQLAIPCSLLVVASRVLHAPEVSLLGQLETIFGILFAWWGAGEVPGMPVFIGGGMVLGALAINELLGWKEHHA
ncbi:MAG: DMT family transporter [Brachymonas sp.]|nr:DMT family transporter [Brachymonas sp.]